MASLTSDKWEDERACTYSAAMDVVLSWYFQIKGALKDVCDLYFLSGKSYGKTDWTYFLIHKSPAIKDLSQFIQLNNLDSPVQSMSLSRMPGWIWADRNLCASWESILSGHSVHRAAWCIFPGLDTFVLSWVWPPLIRHTASPASPVHSLRPRGVNRSMATEQVEMGPQTWSNAVSAYM